MNNWGTDGYSPVGNERLVIEVIADLLERKYTVCYWDDDTARSAYVKQEIETLFGVELNKDFLRLETMTLSGRSMPHYDISVFVNPDYVNKPIVMKECKFAAMICNMEMYV